MIDLSWYICELTVEKPIAGPPERTSSLTPVGCPLAYTKGLAVLAVMLFFMLITPLVIKQMKHSSVSLYKQLCHTPIKLAVIILLQAINIAYVESSFLQSLLFFFAMSFGFVRFYKENLFRDHSDSHQYYYLQETRRVCFWSYKTSLGKLNVGAYYANVILKN